MGKGFMTSRRELVGRMAQAVQHVAGCAAVSVIVTWVDEDEKTQTMKGDTTSANCYGETSGGLPIVSLAPVEAQHIATAHLDEASKMMARQAQAIREFVLPKEPDDE